MTPHGHVMSARLRLWTLSALVTVLLTTMPSMAGAVSPNIVISQIYGGGGNGGANWDHD